MGTWLREEPVHRAYAIAHFLHMTQRESYTSEKMMNKSKSDGPGGKKGAVLAHLGL